jgi:hypothetical protein
VISAPPEVDRPAFYALRSGGWRDLVTILHPPYTAWNLSYVALGAAAAPTFHAGRMIAVLAAFLLAVGVSAHALDELKGRPLKTTLPRWALIALAASTLAGAVAIGVVAAIDVSPLIVPLIVAGALIVPAYNLELFGGRFHNGFWLALAWGAFPAFTSYFFQDLVVRPAGLLVAGGCFALTVAQRRLSTPVRELRRRTVDVSGQQQLRDGSVIELTRASLVAPLERALMALSFGMVLLATGFVLLRLSA